MNSDELLVAYCNRETGHTRKVGQIWASDLYNIIQKKVVPANYFKREPIKLEGVRNILSGIAFEKQWEEVLLANGVKHEYNKRLVYALGDDLELIIRPDFIFEDRVVETKFPVREHDDIPAWYAYQMEAEFRVTGLPVFAGYFSHPFDIKFKKFEPLDSRWDKIKKAVYEFDEQLKLIK